MHTNKGGQKTRVLRLTQVLDRVGLSRSTVYERIKKGTFPRQITLGARAVGWLEHEIDAWLLDCIENSGASANKVFGHTVFEQDGQTVVSRGEGRQVWEN